MVGGNFLNDYVIGKITHYTLKDKFPFQKKLYSSIVIKMMKSPQDICERNSSSYIQNLQSELEFCISIYLS